MPKQGVKAHHCLVVCCNVQDLNFGTQNRRPSNFKVIFPAAILQLSLSRWLQVSLPVLPLWVKLAVAYFKSGTPWVFCRLLQALCDHFKVGQTLQWLQCTANIECRNVTGAGWQVNCDPMRHVSSCIGVASLRIVEILRYFRHFFAELPLCYPLQCHTHTCLTTLFRDYPGELVPER